MRKSIIFALATSMLTLFAAADKVKPDKGCVSSSPDWFNVKIETPGDKYITKYKFPMDVKDGTIGFNRTGATEFKAYINGTQPEHSFLITDEDKFVYLEQIGPESERYDFKCTAEFPETEYDLFNAWWSIVEGNLACHNLTNGFKYFPDGTGGYEIHWDTRASEGLDVLMRVD